MTSYRTVGCQVSVADEVVRTSASGAKDDGKACSRRQSTLDYPMARKEAHAPREAGSAFGAHRGVAQGSF